jgi:hypothetical protein
VFHSFEQEQNRGPPRCPPIFILQLTRPMRPSFAISTSARQFRQLPSRSVPWTRLPYRTPRSRNLTPNTSHRSFSSTSLTMQSIFKAAVNVFSSTPATTVKPFDYPKAHRSDHIDVYKSKKEGEVKVHDPYQWLEEKSPETDKWVEGPWLFRCR